MVFLSAPVGLLGANRADDVRLIQRLLNQWSFVTPYGRVCLVETGRINADTIEAIRLFERNILGLPATGQVQPGTRVWDALAEAEPWTSAAWRPPRTRTGRGETWVRTTF